MFGREHGSKIGSGGINSETLAKIDRRERLRQIAMETIDLSKDPYFMKNHYGTYECRLCSTLHNNEGNYLAHTQGKRHQTNLARRAAKEARDNPPLPQPSSVKKNVVTRKVARIGNPQYRYIKQRDEDTDQLSLLFLIEYPEIEPGTQPRHRFASSFEQKVEAPDKNYQYIVFAAEPYNTIAFKIPNKEIEREVDPLSGKQKFWTYWDKEKKLFALQLYFK